MNGGTFICNICFAGGFGDEGVFHCSNDGCEYDVCTRCNEKDKVKNSVNPGDAKEDVVKEAPIRGCEQPDGALLKITFVTSDCCEKSYHQYFATMPWNSVGFDVEKCKKITKEYGVTTTPTLIVLNKDGKSVATITAREDVDELGPLECMQKWIGLIK
jgi:hypothetical protein